MTADDTGGDTAGDTGGGNVRLDVDGPVALITLDRPERRNAVDHRMVLDLLAIQSGLTARDDVRVVVVTGTAPAFSAGADLHGVEEGEFTSDLQSVLRGFGSLPMPVIAAIDGPALGAGTQVVVAADLRIATPDSVLGIPAAKLGIAVDHWTIRRLADEFTSPVARAMLVGAETYRAERLHELGAIHRLGDLSTALEWAHRLAALAPLTMATHKLGLETTRPHDTPVAAFEAARAAAWTSADAAEGRAAFLAKRRAEFTGR